MKFQKYLRYTAAAMVGVLMTACDSDETDQVDDAVAARDDITQEIPASFTAGDTVSAKGDQLYTLTFQTDSTDGVTYLSLQTEDGLSVSGWEYNYEIEGDAYSSLTAAPHSLLYYDLFLDFDEIYYYSISTELGVIASTWVTPLIYGSGPVADARNDVETDGYSDESMLALATALNAEMVNYNPELSFNYSAEHGLYMIDAIGIDFDDELGSILKVRGVTLFWDLFNGAYFTLNDTPIFSGPVEVTITGQD